jgi:hypothetical protein
MNSDIPLLVRRGGRDSGRGGRSQARYGCLSDHPVCGTKVGFAEIFLMPQPPLLTRRGIGEIVPRGDTLDWHPSAFAIVIATVDEPANSNNYMVYGEDRAKRLQSRNPGDDTSMGCLSLNGKDR